MFIITVLDLQTNEITIVDIFNDELNAQNTYMDKIVELSTPDESSSDKYESLYVTKTRCNIFTKYSGWTGTTKYLAKIVTLHEVADYCVSDS